MVTKRMNLAAKSIQNLNNNIKNSISQGRYGYQYALFASAIIEKYAKTLNYHFDYTALVFLEQMAGWEKRQQISKNVINLTWKLLSFLFQEGDKRNAMLYQNPRITEQLTKQIEDNLQQIKKEKRTEYYNLERCYKIYQREIKKEDLSKKTRQEKIEKVRDYVEKQVRYMYFAPKRKEEKLHAITPFTMNYGFFYNLNRAISDNKIMNYRQIWKKSVEKQLEQYYLGISMNTFTKEQQTELKQEIFLDILHHYDGDAIQTYLMNTNEKVYTQFWDYVQSIINVTHVMAEAKEKKNLEEKTGTDNKKVNDLAIREKTEADREFYKEERQKRLAEDIEEYKHIHRKITDILEQTREITKNIIIEKAREYKELFYTYIYGEKNKNSNNENKDLKEYKQVFPAYRYEEKDPEVFSDNEIALLLKEQEMVNNKEEYPLELQQEITYLKEKLSLLAMKAVVERCLMEDTGILHREKIENIAEILEKVDFYTKRKEEHSSPIQEIQSVVEKQVIQQNIENNSEIGIENIKIVFQEGILPEKKLLYLAMEKGIDEILTKEEKENFKIQKQILELKRKIIQEEDYRKRILGDWRFLMKKSRSTEIVKAIEKLEQEEKTNLEERVREIIQTFHHIQDEIYHLYQQFPISSIQTKNDLKTVYEKNENLWKEWSAYFSKEEMIQIQEKRIEQQEKRMEQNSWSDVIKLQNANTEVQNALINNTNMQRRQYKRNESKDFILPENIQVKDIIEILHNERSPEKEFLLLALQKIFSQETKFLTKKSDSVGILQAIEEIKKLSEETKVEEYKKSFMESKSIEKFIFALDHLTAEEKKEIESQISIYRNQFYHYLLRQKEKETKEIEELQDEKIVKSITAITMESIKTVFQEGMLPERKLLYLAMEKGIDEILTKEEKEKSKIQKQILELKREIIKEEDYRKRILGDWRFLMKKSRSTEIVKAIEELEQEEKTNLEERVREKIQTFHQMQDEIYHLYQQSQISSLETQNDLKMVYEKNENLWKEWSAYFSKEEMIQIQEKRIEQQEKRMEQNSWSDAKWFSYLEKEEIEELRSKQIYFLKAGYKENMKSLEEMMSVGTLAERKFLFLSMQAVLEEGIIETGMDPDRWTERGQLVMLKRELVSEQIKEQIMKKDWNFLQESDQKNKIIKVFQAFHKETKEKFMRNMRKEVHRLYFFENLEEKRINNVSEDIISYAKKKEKDKLYDSIKLFYKDIINEKSNYLMKERNRQNVVNKKNKFTEFKNNDRKNVKIIDKKLKIFEKYVNILRIDRKYKEKSYNFVKNLSRKKNNYWKDISQNNVYLTQNNIHFMEPPVSSIGREKVSIMSESLQYQGENVHFILDHIRKEKDLHNNNPNTSLDEQMREIKELKNHILEYQMELKEKEEKIETVEKKLKNQEENIQFLKNTQDNISREVNSSAEAKKMMERLKDELQLEQMRNGIL